LGTEAVVREGPDRELRRKERRRHPVGVRRLGARQREGHGAGTTHLVQVHPGDKLRADDGPAHRDGDRGAGDLAFGKELSRWQGVESCERGAGVRVRPGTTAHEEAEAGWPREAL
jgi:hypothetical protein